MTSIDHKTVPSPPPHAHHSLQELPLPSAKLRRLDGVQMLRAVAVFSVAWLHAGQVTAQLGAKHFLPDLGLSGVDLFFVISGFILCLLTLRDKQQTPGPHTSWNFLQRRIARIFPVYWIFAARQIVHHLHHGWADSRHYAPALFLLPGYAYPALPLLANFSWTLIFEMFFYLVLAVMLLFTVRRAATALIALLTAFVLLGLLVGTHRPILMVICNPMLLEFAFGALIAILYAASETRRDFSFTRSAGRVLLGSGIAGAIVLGLSKPHWIAPYQNQILAGDGVLARALTWGVACALVLAGVVLLSPSLKSRLGRTTVALGNASYSTYLLSGMAFPYIAAWFYPIGKSHPVHFIAVLALIQVGVVAVILCVGLVFYQFIERPLIRHTYHLLARRDN